MSETDQKTEPKPARASCFQRRSEWSDWTVVAMLVLCFFVLIQFGPLLARSGQQHTGVGQTLPGLKLHPLTGAKRSVSQGDLTGRVVLVSFFGTESEASYRPLPHLAKIKKRFQGRTAFRLLAVSCGRGMGMKEDVSALRDETKTFLRDQDLDLPTYADLGGVTRLAVDEAVGFGGLPTTLILDRTGQVCGVWTGFQQGVESEMEQLVAQLLGGG